MAAAAGCTAAKQQVAAATTPSLLSCLQPPAFSATPPQEPLHRHTQPSNLHSGLIAPGLPARLMPGGRHRQARAAE